MRKSSFVNNGGNTNLSLPVLLTEPALRKVVVDRGLCFRPSNSGKRYYCSSWCSTWKARSTAIFACMVIDRLRRQHRQGNWYCPRGQIEPETLWGWFHLAYLCCRPIRHCVKWLSTEPALCKVAVDRRYTVSIRAIRVNGTIVTDCRQSWCWYPLARTTSSFACVVIDRLGRQYWLETVSKHRSIHFANQSIRLYILAQSDFGSDRLWAASWQKKQNGMCAQRRLRSAWASAQSDHSLRCPHEESSGP